MTVFKDVGEMNSNCSPVNLYLKIEGGMVQLTAPEGHPGVGSYESDDICGDDKCVVVGVFEVTND
jgi:hypothetical protein